MLPSYNNTTGGNNTANGIDSLYTATSTSGTTAFGYQAGKLMSGATGAVGNYNTLIGYQAGYDITTGGNNLILGTEQTTATGITTGSGNIIIGNGYNGLTNTASNQLNIGNLIFGTGLASGNTLSTGNVGIGTTNPQNSLDVNGGMAIGSYAGNNAAGSGNLIVSGNVGIGTTSPGTLLSIGNTGGINFTLATSTFSTTGGINLASGGCFAINGTCIGGGAGAVSSVSNSDGTLTISPTSGAVVASLALGHANSWTGQQTFGTSAPIISALGTGLLKGNGSSALTVASNGTDYTLTSAQTCSAGSFVSALTAAGGSTCTAGNTGTVTAVSVATANGVSGTSSGGATPALTISLGAITPTTVNGLAVSLGANSVSTNVAVGNGALASGSLSGGNNTANGYASLYSNTTGVKNTANG